MKNAYLFLIVVLVTDGLVVSADSAEKPLTEQSREEIATHTREESYGAAKNLMTPLGVAVNEGNASRAKDLSRKIHLIMEAIVANETIDRFREEIAARSPEQNRREAQSLATSLKKAVEQGNVGGAKDLAVEIKLIMEALLANETIDRFRKEIAARSSEENRRAANNLMASLKKAVEARNVGRIKDLAVEIGLIMEAVENKEDGNRSPED